MRNGCDMLAVKLNNSIMVGFVSSCMTRRRDTLHQYLEKPANKKINGSIRSLSGEDFGPGAI